MLGLLRSSSRKERSPHKVASGVTEHSGHRNANPSSLKGEGGCPRTWRSGRRDGWAPAQPTRTLNQSRCEFWLAGAFYAKSNTASTVVLVTKRISRPKSPPPKLAAFGNVCFEKQPSLRQPSTATATTIHSASKAKVAAVALISRSAPAMPSRVGVGCSKNKCHHPRRATDGLITSHTKPSCGMRASMNAPNPQPQQSSIANRVVWCSQKPPSC